MGNIDSSEISEEIEQIQQSKQNGQGRFVLNFISATDIPTLDFQLTNSDLYLKAYISIPSIQPDGSILTNRISDTVQTPRRTNCTTTIWNCYRDLRYDPPPDSLLTIELYDCNREKIEKDPIGSANIPIDIFSDDFPHSFLFIFHKVIILTTLHLYSHLPYILIFYYILHCIYYIYIRLVIRRRTLTSLSPSAASSSLNQHPYRRHSSS